MKIVFVPFKHNNDYIEINKEAISTLGLRPVPFSLKALFESSIRRYPLVLNWVEDKPYGSHLSGSQRFTTFLKCILLVVMGAFFFSRTISVRHNFKPHNIEGKGLYFTFLRGLMYKLGYKVVSLEEYEGGGLHHPLYLDDEKMEVPIEPCGSEPFSYMFFGAIKPYKGVDVFLKTWPSDRYLKILGKCNDREYEKVLHKIILERGLKITWENSFLPIERLNKELSVTNFVIMNHLDNTMISSGSFYHAISFGCNIIAAPSKFITGKGEQHQFVHIYGDLNVDLPKFEAAYVCKNKVRKEAKSRYSRQKLSEKWRQLLLR